MIIKMSKCCKFSTKNQKAKPVQDLPYITILKDRIPPVKIRGNFMFTIWGKIYCFNMVTSATEASLGTCYKIFKNNWQTSH